MTYLYFVLAVFCAFVTYHFASIGEDLLACINGVTTGMLTTMFFISVFEEEE